MIQIAVFQFKSVTLKVVTDKKSKDKTYIDGDNFITLDKNWLKKQAFLVWDAMPDKRKKVTEVIMIRASNVPKLKTFIRSEDVWVESKVKGFKTNSAGYTILSNF